MKVINDLLLASDKGLVSILVLLDLVLHMTPLIMTLYYRDCNNSSQGTAMSWLKSYSPDLFQLVLLLMEPPVRA